jgi:diacylglycerol kinase family enzyme
MRTILFFNPTAGGGKFSKKELKTALKLGGYSVSYCSTKGRRFERMLDEPADLFVVAGGDGTVAKVVRQMPDRDIPVAILPIGSANNIARTFGIAGAPYELAEILHPRYWQLYTIGMARGPWGERRFVEAVGLGPLARLIRKPSLDAAVGVDSLQQGRRELRKAMGKAKPLDVEVHIDGKAVRGDLLSVEVINTVYTGPGLPLAPSANPGDRLLEVVCVRPDDRKSMMTWIGAPQHRQPPVSIRRGRKVSIVWRKEPIRLDDEAVDAPKGTATVAVQLERAAAKILVPPPRGIRRLWRNGS